MNKKEFQRIIGASVDGIIGPASVAKFDAIMRNTKATKITAAEYEAAAKRLNVPVGHVRAIAKVEAGPQGSFDDYGRPTILYERHKFRDATGGIWNKRFPTLSGPRGGYGKYSAQWPKLLDAIRLDPDAAISSCSWGLFQVMGFHWKSLGYSNALDMALTMAASEGAHLDALVRYILVNRLDDELRACRKGDARSCAPFARGYNGSAYAENAYHIKIAGAL